MVFIGASRQIPVECLKFDYNLFRPQPFVIRRYVILPTDNSLKIRDTFSEPRIVVMCPVYNTESHVLGHFTEASRAEC